MFGGGLFRLRSIRDGTTAKIEYSVECQMNGRTRGRCPQSIGHNSFTLSRGIEIETPIGSAHDVGSTAGSIRRSRIRLIVARKVVADCDYLHFERPIAMSDLLGAAGLLVAITLCAGGIPAMRAATLHPMKALCRDS
jgi:hypothetical protein